VSDQISLDFKYSKKNNKGKSCYTCNKCEMNPASFNPSLFWVSWTRRVDYTWSEDISFNSPLFVDTHMWGRAAMWALYSITHQMYYSHISDTAFAW